MPTGNCRFPEHHSPSTGPPLGLLAAIALGALIIAFWHQVVVALVVVAILACIAGIVLLVIHNHLHLHGVSGDDIAAAARQAIDQPADRK